MTKFFYFLLILTICYSCGDHVMPKPNAYLRLEYPEAQYTEAHVEYPFSFEVNKLATKITAKPIRSTTESYGVNIEYPSLKGTIFLTYKSIDNNPDNLISFLRDAQNFTQKHTIKADEIPMYPYENKEKKVYGMFSEVKGNVASPAQFYVTDSIHHFLTGSLYFYAKPNYDSILPAADYLEKDIRHIMETIKWK
ncbi:gliding motility lipoprotein GldD [Confluentibacter sediminis]|uniref:gliding motility lipoprotein GldD n=1 Tax=Confluentibacter sediminis TaxID=2219045 RepID=UPI000DABFF3B|nr:gliding motility lipoprotein GldD [Confluentibacter sediminis]